MVFRTPEAAMETAQPGDRVIRSGDHYLIESPGPLRGELVSSAYVAPIREPRQVATSMRSVVPENMGQPMTRGQRAVEDVLEARESGRRPGFVKSTVAFLHRRGIIR